MSQPATLSFDLLKHFETLLNREQAPLSDLLQPGLTAEQMDTVTAPIGLHLPAEARIWWAWHDGALASPDENSREFGYWALLPLEEAVQHWRMMREIAEEAAEEDGLDPDLQWHPDWFPIASRGAVVVCDCSVESEMFTPIRVVDYHADPDTFTTIRARSLGEMVGWWVEALETGALRFDLPAARWQRDESLIDNDRLETRLI